MRAFRYISIWLGLMAAGCATSPTRELLADFGDQTTAWSEMGICAGYGCTTYYKLGLDTAEAGRILAAYGAPAASPAEERQAIRRAVAEIELIVGPKTGTDGDEPGAAIINFSRRGQMDCIDESFNTTTYLRLMEKHGLLRFHKVGEPLRRGYFLDRWPHNTATVIDLADGQRYVVDSWFHGNGVPPEVVAAEEWLKGWHPETQLPALTSDQAASVVQ